MKTIHPAPWLRIAFLCLALALALILLTIPLLAKGISGIASDPIQAEKIDIRPIPVPVPPPPLALDGPLVVATSPAPNGAAVPVAIPVPTPDPALQSQAVAVQSALPEFDSTRQTWTISLPEVTGGALIFLILLMWFMSYRTLHFRYQPKECAG